ncbi:MAG: hypothetical protein IJZ74_03490 [Clostridia bacterium]|nr:hypothetical protein [Clostridia bacterium]
MKQRFLVCLTLTILLVLGLCGAAMAASDPIALEMELSNERFSGPAEVTVTIRVTNTGDTDMPGPMALYYPNGSRVEEFGTPTLAAGASASWTGTWTVTQEQLTQGRLTFAIRYPIINDDGMMVDKQKNFFYTIIDAGAVAEVEINRYITPSMAGKGQEVSVIYEVANVGTIDITDVVIEENAQISKTAGKILGVKAGEKATYVFPVTMGTKNLTSSATISYKANGSTYTTTKDPATIKYGSVKLEASLKADKKGGVPGDTVKLTLTLKNTGKADYQNVTVTDPALGTIFSGLTVEAGKTVTQEKEITISKSAEYQFTVSGTNASGETIETATGRVAVTAVDQTKAVSLQVDAVADKTTIYMLPGIVKFTVSVTNTAGVEATNVSVSATGVTLYNFESILPGQTRSFTRDVRVETPGQFRFDAHVADQLGQTVTFEGNIVRIVHSSPTATPSQVPLATPPRPHYEDLPSSDGLPSYVDTVQQALSIGRWVFLALGGVCLTLVIIGAASRIARANKSKKAPDHLERDGYRDYTQAVPAKKRHMMPESELPDLPVSPTADPAEEGDLSSDPALAEPAEDGSLMEQAMSELYPDAAVQPDAPAGEDANATYRRRRRNADEE